jgi:fluoride ion exporter CrcB/FEX
MAAVYVLIGIAIGRGWRFVVDQIAERVFELHNEPGRKLVYYLATALVSGATFSFLPFGPAPFTDPRRYLHAGLIAGFVVFQPFVEEAAGLRKRRHDGVPLLYLLGSSGLMLLALGGGYLLGSQNQMP